MSGRGLATQEKPRRIMPEPDHNNVCFPQTAGLMTWASVTPLSAEAMKLCKALVASRTAVSWLRVNSSYHPAFDLPSVQQLQHWAKNGALDCLSGFKKKELVTWSSNVLDGVRLPEILDVTFSVLLSSQGYKEVVPSECWPVLKILHLNRYLCG